MSVVVTGVPLQLSTTTTSTLTSSIPANPTQFESNTNSAGGVRTNTSAVAAATSRSLVASSAVVTVPAGERPTIEADKLSISTATGLGDLPSFNSISTAHHTYGGGVSAVSAAAPNTNEMRHANPCYNNPRGSPAVASSSGKSAFDPISVMSSFIKEKILRGHSIDIIPIVIACGFSLASYAYYVEHRLEESKQLGSKYTAACDIGIFSCTKVFSSEFGYLSQFFGLPKISNALVGMMFYAFLFFLHFLTTVPLLSKKSAASGKPFWPTMFSIQPEPRGIVLSALAFFGVLGALSSCMLFYILTVKLHDLCIVCCSIYVVNFTLLFTTVPRYFRYVKRRAKEEHSPVMMAVGGGNAAERWV